MARVAAVDNRLRPISTGVKGQSARASGRQAGGDCLGASGWNPGRSPRI